MAATFAKVTRAAGFAATGRVPCWTTWTAPRAMALL